MKILTEPLKRRGLSSLPAVFCVDGVAATAAIERFLVKEDRSTCMLSCIMREISCTSDKASLLVSLIYMLQREQNISDKWKGNDNHDAILTLLILTGGEG